MIRAFTVFVLASLTVFSLAGGERTRSPRPGSLGASSSKAGSAARTLVRNAAAARRTALSTQTRMASTAAASSTLAAAPGVVQINVFDTNHEAYFVCSESIPPDTTIQAFIVLPDLNELALSAATVTTELQAGDSLILPSIRNFGDFWPFGMTTYYVVVTRPDGTQSLAAADFATSGYHPDYSVAQTIVPGIDSYIEYLADDGSTMLRIQGRFLTNTATIVALEDTIVPSDSIYVEDARIITVNVSRASRNYWDSSAGAYTPAYFDTSTQRHALLTVGQYDGQYSWSDTLPFRHVPLK